MKKLLVTVIALLSFTQFAFALPDLVISDLWSDLDTVLVNQEFTISYKTSNTSNEDIPKDQRITQKLYINGNLHGSLGSDGMDANSYSVGSFKIKIDKAGTAKIKIVTDADKNVYESNGNNNSYAIKIKVLDWESYATECLELHEKADKYLQQYNNDELFNWQMQSRFHKLAIKSDKLALLATDVRPTKALEKFNRYMAVGTKRLSSSLWDLWLAFAETNSGYFTSGKNALVEAKKDILVAMVSLGLEEDYTKDQSL